jgi:tetrahydromethanopterin S-methyltransferase subunit B
MAPYKPSKSGAAAPLGKTEAMIFGIFLGIVIGMIIAIVVP